MTAVLDQAALQISREREASQPRTPLLLLPELLRNALASLALVLGFAALARRPGSTRSLLQEWRGPGAIGNGAWSGAGPRAGEARPMRSTSGSSVGRSRSPSCTSA